jgi:hypothetical protein
LEVVVVWSFDVVVAVKPFEDCDELVLVAKLSRVCGIARNGYWRLACCRIIISCFSMPQVGKKHQRPFESL